MPKDNVVWGNPGALGLAAMKKISEEMDNLMGWVTNLEKTPEFLYDVEQSIVECLNIEKKAFQTLSSII